MKSTEPGHIAERAYYIWKQKGCPEGNELEHWVQAEAELSARATTHAQAPAASPTGNGAPIHAQPPAASPATPTAPTAATETRPRRKKR